MHLIEKGKEHFFYVGATLITAAIHFLYSVFVKAHIEPLDFGIYSTCLLLKTYFSYAQLGSLNAFNRDYPQLVGAGCEEEAKRYRDTTFTYLLFVFLILSLVLSIAIIVIGKINNIDKRYVFGLVFCAYITATNIIESFLASRVRIDGSFKYTSLVILTELLATFIGFIIIPFIGYYALYIVTICSSFIGIVMYYKRGISDISFHIDKNLLKTIIISGLPLLINNLIWTIVDSIDKFVILGFMDAERLGLYSIAQMAFSYMILIPSAMSQLFYVKLGKIYGTTGSEDQLNEVAINYTQIIAIVMSFFVLIAYYFMEPLVLLIMPKYSDGIKSAQILMLALVIYAPTLVNGNILTILKKNAALLRGSIYLCIFNAIFSVGFVVLLGDSINSVALGTAVSYLMRTLVLIIQLRREANLNVAETIKASIVPVILFAGPGIVFYHLVMNRIIGFILAIANVLIMLFVVYRKKVLNFLNR